MRRTNVINFYSKLEKQGGNLLASFFTIQDPGLGHPDMK